MKYADIPAAGILLLMLGTTQEVSGQERAAQAGDQPDVCHAILDASQEVVTEASEGSGFSSRGSVAIASDGACVSADTSPVQSTSTGNLHGDNGVEAAQDDATPAGGATSASTTEDALDPASETPSDTAQLDVEEEADVEAGEALYRSTCRNCHGPRAQGMASFPGLAGHDEDHLISRLVQYRSGERVGANSGIMSPIARDLSDQDIADVSAYIATAFD